MMVRASSSAELSQARCDFSTPYYPALYPTVGAPMNMNTCPMFAGRVPSAAWEPVALLGLPQLTGWVWFKPVAAPQSMLLKLADELYATPVLYGQATLRNLLFSLGLNPAGLHSWQINGAMYESMGGTSPVLDQVIPLPVAGIDPVINLYFNVPMMNVPMMAPQAPMPMMPVASPVEAVPAQAVPVQAEPAQVATPETNSHRVELPKSISANAAQYAEIFERIEADWSAIQQMERQLSNQRKKYVAMINKLNSLNRELTTEEKLLASRQQISEWEDTKRWLRDNSMRLSKHVKALDIGETSAAGKREWFTEIYDNYVVPRQPFQGVEHAQRDFEMHRKMLKSLAGRIGSAQSDAVADGERRANSVLSRISATVKQEAKKRRIKTEQFARAKSSYFH